MMVYIDVRAQVTFKLLDDTRMYIVHTYINTQTVIKTENDIKQRGRSIFNSDEQLLQVTGIMQSLFYSCFISLQPVYEEITHGISHLQNKMRVRGVVRTYIQSAAFFCFVNSRRYVLYFLFRFPINSGKLLRSIYVY